MCRIAERRLAGERERKLTRGELRVAQQNGERAEGSLEGRRLERHVPVIEVEEGLNRVAHEETLSIRLPDVQAARQIAGRGLSTWIRYQIALGELDKAEEAIKVGFAVNRHYARQSRLDVCNVRGWWEDAGKHWQHLAEIGRTIDETGVNK